MKYILEKDKIKSFFKKRFGVDLTDKITMITSVKDIPRKFIRVIDTGVFNNMLNKFGPMYLIKVKDSEYLTQERNDIYKDYWFVLSDKDADDIFSIGKGSDPLLKEIGLDGLGINLGTIIDIYFEEEDTLESINESKGFANVIGNYMSINYPNFTKENAKIVKVRKNRPGVFRPEMSINYYNPVNEFLFAKYWHNDVNKDIQLDCEIFNDLEMTFGGHMDKIVDWFNNEFGQDAESVTC